MHTGILRPYLPGLTAMPLNQPASEGEKLILPESWVGQRKQFRPIVLLLTGRRGAGKTLAETAILRYQQRRNRELNHLCRVCTNYHVTFADKATPTILDELMTFPAWARNIELGIDEIGSCFPNRRALAGINVMFLQYVGQIRKRATEIIASTRFAIVVDVQHAMEIDLFVRCRAFWITNQSGQVLKDESGRPRQGIDFDIWDYWGQWTDDVRRKYWPPNLEPVDEMRTIYNTQTMWGCYSTDEVVAPLWLENEQRQKVLANEWEELRFKEEAELKLAQDVQPTTFEEFLQDRPGPFNVVSQIDAAAKFMPELLTLSRPAAKKLLAERLSESGYEIEAQGQQYIARRSR